MKKVSIPKETCYDLSVSNNHNFFANGICVHNTNAGICYDVATGDITYQSRERELSLTSDNAGFMLAQLKNEDLWRKHFSKMVCSTDLTKIVIFGEWVGNTIQKGVAISELPKMFVIFSTKFIYDDKSIWSEIEDAASDDVDIPGVYDIEDFQTYLIDIDFNYPELSQNKMLEWTLAVENECPVGKHFGVSGIGEGIVFKCIEEGWEDSGMWFKSKGEKHSVSKVKTLNAIDVEAVENMRAFVDATVTEARLEQGLDNLVREQLLPFEMKSLGDFLRWVYNDIFREEQDTIIASQIDPKKLGSAIANVARPWYIKKFNEGVGL